ncbi:unnamed protein product, partial [Didymodactylos carnosus]
MSGRAQSNPVDIQQRQRVLPISSQSQSLIKQNTSYTPPFPIRSSTPPYVRENIQSKSNIEQRRKKKSSLTDHNQLKDVPNVSRR